MKHLIRVPIFIIALVLSACGGDSTTTTTNASPQTTQPGATTTAGETTTTTQAAAEDGAGSMVEGTATATIGDMTWHFALTGDGRELCNPDFSGFFMVNMFGVDDAGQQVAITIQASTAGGPVVIQAGDPSIAGELWKVDPAVYTDYGTVTGIPDGITAIVQISGNSISGSGTFYEQRAMDAARSSGTYDLGVKSGTFEAACPAN